MSWLKPPLHTDGRWIRDGDGRALILRGANLSGRHKQPPFVSVAHAEELEGLARRGLRTVRLVLVWEAIEPEPGRIDEVYLEQVAHVVRWAASHELAVIADMHQDLYARALGGSGAPAWSIAPEDREETPPPARDWYLRYATSPGVRRSLARLFTDEALLTHFLSAWRAVAERLAGEPWVIGFEPLNEPFPGELEVERFETEALPAFYRRVVETVRAVAPHWLVFLEGVVLGSESGTRLEVGAFERAVYCPHFYDKLTQVSRRYEGNDLELARVLAVYAADAARMGVPWMLGEYGVPADAPGGAEYLRDHHDALDRYLAGGTVWHYNPTSQDWNEENMSVVAPGGGETHLSRALVRPYPLAVAGTPTLFDFDPKRGRCVLEYQADGSAAETVLFLPLGHFGALPRVEASVGRALHSATAQEVRLRTPGHRGPVRLLVRPS